MKEHQLFPLNSEIMTNLLVHCCTEIPLMQPFQYFWLFVTNWIFSFSLNFWYEHFWCIFNSAISLAYKKFALKCVFRYFQSLTSWDWATVFSFKFDFDLTRAECLFRFSWSCMPSFNLLRCLELVKKFIVVGGRMKATLVFIFGPRLGLWLWPRPNLNKNLQLWVKISHVYGGGILNFWWFPLTVIFKDKHEYVSVITNNTFGIPKRPF